MKLFKTGGLNWINNIGTRILVMIFLFTNLFIFAQVPSLQIGNVGVCNASTVLIPLTGTNLSNIGSMTLFINFNDQNLSFSSIENVDPQLTGLQFNILPNPPRVAVVWTNVTGAQFPDNRLMNLKFNILQDAGSLSFDTASEIANVSLQIIPVNYFSGSIYPASPVISGEPEDLTVKSQANAVFQVISPDATGYVWQESRNNGNSWSGLTDGTRYSGIHSGVLTINNVPAQYNKNKYRCILNKTNCQSITNSVILSVDSLTGIENEQKLANLPKINIKPNPFSVQTTVSYFVPDQGDVSIELVTIMGKSLGFLVNGPHSNGEYKLEPDFVSLPVGIYFCNYVFKSSTQTYVAQCKMIKIKND